MMASLLGHLELVQELLARGALAGKATNLGETALALSTRKGHDATRATAFHPAPSRAALERKVGNLSLK